MLWKPAVLKVILMAGACVASGTANLAAGSHTSHNSHGGGHSHGGGSHGGGIPWRRPLPRQGFSPRPLQQWRWASRWQQPPWQFFERIFRRLAAGERYVEGSIRGVLVPAV
jgi:hypothetical protein